MKKSTKTVVTVAVGIAAIAVIVYYMKKRSSSNQMITQTQDSTKNAEQEHVKNNPALPKTVGGSSNG